MHTPHQGKADTCVCCTQAGDLLSELLSRSTLLDSLTPQLAELGAQCIMEVLQGWPTCIQASRVQDVALVTRAPKLRTEMGLLSWSDGNTSLSVEDLMRKWRAFDQSIGIYAFFHEQASRPPRRVKLLKIRPLQEEQATPQALAVSQASSLHRPGSLLFDKTGRGALWLRVQDGWIELEQLQVEHKPRAVSGADFARGRHITDTSNHSFV